jgi:type 1 glutamine amidotransferase
VAWTNTGKHGGRVFYTSLGHIEDFQQPAFNELLVNAIRWAAAGMPEKSSSGKKR